MTHRRRHGGYSVQAKRRGESWITCTDCTTHLPSRIRQAEPIDLDEPVTWPRIAGLVIFAFGLIFVFPFALLVLVAGVLA